MLPNLFKTKKFETINFKQFKVIDKDIEKPKLSSRGVNS